MRRDRPSRRPGWHRFRDALVTQAYVQESPHTRYAAAMLSFAHMKVTRNGPGQRSRRSTQTRARAIVAPLDQPNAAEPASSSATTRPTSRQLVRNHLLPLALYLLITIVTTYPLILHFGTHLPGDGRDAW